MTRVARSADDPLWDEEQPAGEPGKAARTAASERFEPSEATGPGPPKSPHAAVSCPSSRPARPRPPGNGAASGATRSEP